MNYKNRDYERISIDSARREYYWLRKNEIWNNIYETPKDPTNVKDLNMLIICPACGEYIKTSKTSLKKNNIKCFKCKNEPTKLTEEEEQIEKFANKFNDISKNAFKIEKMEEMVQNVKNKGYIIEDLINEHNNWYFKVNCAQCNKFNRIQIKNEQVNPIECNHSVGGSVYCLLFENNICKIGSTRSVKNRMLSKKEGELGILRTTKFSTNLNESWFVKTHSTTEQNANKHEELENELKLLLKEYSTNINHDSNGGTEYFKVNKESKEIIRNWLYKHHMKPSCLLDELIR